MNLSRFHLGQMVDGDKGGYNRTGVTKREPRDESYDVVYDLGFSYERSGVGQ